MLTFIKIVTDKTKNRLVKMGKIYLTTFLFFITSTAVFNQTLEDSLAAYYNFNNTLNDASGNIKHITEAEGAFTADRFGSPNAAFHFDGENDSLVLPVDKFAPITGDFAISFWYKTNSSAIMNLVSSKQSPDDTTQNFEIQLNSHNRFYLEYYKQVWYQTYVYWNGTGIESNALAEGVAGNFIKGEWSHFVISREADTFKIYRNHQLYYLSINTYFADELGDAINMVFSAMPYRFKGDIDDLRFYKRALSQQDIDLLWFENNPIQFVNPQATDAYVFGSNVLVYWEYDTTQISDSIMVTYSINNGAWINADHSRLAFENYTYVDMSFARVQLLRCALKTGRTQQNFSNQGNLLLALISGLK
ncbi:MAG: LamG domain-containing protein [Bacteroidetes bacterium]|nr:LamG domain-containing protein [Bacteroidota bacterium]